MTTFPPIAIRVVCFDIRSIPKKPPAPSVRPDCGMLQNRSARLTGKVCFRECTP
jgi:hypothetical protein